MNLIELGRFLIIAGLIITAIGCVFIFADKIPIGKLPGDFNFGRNNFKIYIPITTCIVLSIIITLIFNFFSRK